MAAKMNAKPTAMRAVSTSPKNATLNSAQNTLSSDQSRPASEGDRWACAMFCATAPKAAESMAT